MIAAWLGAIVAAWGAPAQSSGLSQETVTPLELALAAHLEVARAERELLFFERYGAAPESARLRARSVLERLRSPGAAGHSTASALVVSKALRSLRAADSAGDGRTPRELERLEELVDALEVQLVPGIFEARSGAALDSRPGTIRALVSPLYPPPERLEVTLSLVWTRPDGSSVLAYRGLAKPSVFDPAGFSVELAGAAGGGDWRLALEVERDGFSARGEDQVVQFVQQLEQRAARQFADLETPQDVRAPVARWLALLQQRGLRILVRGQAEPWLEWLEGTPRPGSATPWRSLFAGPGSEPQWIWRLEPGAQAEGAVPRGPLRGTLLVIAPRGEPAEAVLHRPGWERFSGWRVLSAQLPRGGAEGTVLEFFAALRRELEQDSAAGPLVVVARGDAPGQLAMAYFGQGARPYAAEVLPLPVVQGAPEGLTGPVPRVVIAPGAPAGSSAGKPAPVAASTWWIPCAGVPLIAEQELLEHLHEALGLLRESLESEAAPLRGK